MITICLRWAKNVVGKGEFFLLENTFPQDHFSRLTLFQITKLKAFADNELTLYQVTKVFPN